MLNMNVEQAFDRGMATGKGSELAPEQMRALRPDSLLVRVRSITYLAEDINAYEVVSVDDCQLPTFSAGSHIDLYFRDGRTRQYSLCNDPNDKNRYVFAVQREIEGRGGSKAIFDRIHVGRILSISKPRNNFQLIPAASTHLLLAGGIGITPIFSMIKSLDAAGQHFNLHYCTRSKEKTSFYDEVADLANRGVANLYHDGGEPKSGLDLRKLLSEYSEGTHLYFCGPPGFMNAVRKASEHWPSTAVHFEYFSATSVSDNLAQSAILNGDISVGFQIQIASTGKVLDVPNDKSIAQVLRENGIEVETSCEAGVCGACRTKYLSGTPDHRDYVLTDEEKADTLLVCCSRSKSGLLVLDL
jgi:vanillate O-demethylase ferredoxin subunit